MLEPNWKSLVCFYFYIYLYLGPDEPGHRAGVEAVPGVRGGSGGPPAARRGPQLRLHRRTHQEEQQEHGQAGGRSHA